MAWFKADDKLWGHSKWRQLSKGGRALWTTAGSWSADHLTDGQVPRHMLAILDGTPREAADLVKCGLWETTEDGWRFHDWPEYQPSSEQVQADRHAARERQRKARERAKAERESRQQSRRDSRVSDTVSHGPPDPTRPDPTRSSYGTTKSASRSGGKRRAPEKPIPDDWRPTTDHQRYAEDHHLELSSEAFRFRNHALSHDRRQRDWNAAFRVWLSKAVEFAKDKPKPERSGWDRKPPPDPCGECNAPPEVGHYDQCPHAGGAA